METIQLFLSINKSGLDNDWNRQINASLKALNGIENVEIIEQNESGNAQIIISYNAKQLSLNEIESVVKSSGAIITEINIHLPSNITGVADVYGARIVANTAKGDLKDIDGVKEIGISSKGVIKAVIDPGVTNKQAVVDNILQQISNLD